MSSALLSFLMPSENPTPSHKMQIFFQFCSQYLQIENSQWECIHWFVRDEEAVRDFQTAKQPQPQQSGQDIIQGCGKCTDRSFGFLHIPSACYNHRLWKQGVEIFQILQKRTLKLVKFILLWKGKKYQLELFLHKENCFLLSTRHFQIVVSNMYKHTFIVFNCRVWVGITSEEYLNIPIGYLNNTGLRFCLQHMYMCVFFIKKPMFYHKNY